MKKLTRCVSAAVSAAVTLQFAAVPACAAKFPEKYDSRDEGIISEVRNQGMIGACWAFGALDMLETYMRKNSLGDYDFSERHMDITTALAYYDKMNFDHGGARNYAMGGKASDSISYFYSGKGPVLEKNYAFIPTYEGNYADPYANTLCETAGIFVKDIGLVGSEGMGGYVTVSVHNDDIMKMKKHIMEMGALAVTYYAGDKSEEEYYYYDGIAPMNHEVTIVGWDDTIPREKFASENGGTPEEDGAWIVKNSWGKDYGDDGYFYLSYGDSQLYSFPYFYIERVEKTDYDQIYLSCPRAASRYITSGNPDEGVDYSLNVFTKTGNSEQSLGEITACFREGTSYEIYVIPEFTDGGSNRGKPVAKGYADHDCYKTVEFDPVEITGDDYAVCVKYTNKDKYKSLVAAQETAQTAGGLLGKDSSGYSFVSSDGEHWQDTVKHYSSVVFMRAYTENTEKTYNVKFADKKRNYEYAELSKDGRKIYANPDGSFDVAEGTYDYAVKEAGFETKTGRIKVDKNILKSVSLKAAPSVDLVNFEIGLKDPGDFTLSYIYGMEGEKLIKAKSLEVDGKEVKFVQTEDGIEIKRSDLSFLDGKKEVLFAVTYSNGAVSSVKLDVTKLTDQGKTDIIDSKIQKYIQNSDINKSTDLSLLAEKCREIVSAHSKKAVFTVDDAQIYPTENGIGYYFSYLVAYGRGYRYTTVSKNLEAAAPSKEPTMSGISGWIGITASDELKKAVSDGGEVTITLGSNKTVPASFWKKVQGSKAVVNFVVPQSLNEYGYSFRVNCSDILCSHDIDMTLYKGLKDASATYDDSILLNYSTYLAGTSFMYYMDDSFDIKADLTINYILNKSKYIINDFVFRYDSENVLEMTNDYGTVITRRSGRTVLKDYDGEFIGLYFTINMYMYGDMDFTCNDPDMQDVQMLMYYISSGTAEQIKELSPMMYALMDCDEDGDVDNDDCRALKDYIEECEKEKEEKKAA